MSSLKSLFFKNPVIQAGFFILCVSILPTSCVRTFDKSQKIVIQIEEQTLTAQEFGQQLARRLKDLDALSAKDPNVVDRSKEEIVKSFISKSLTTLWAKEMKILLSEADLEKEITSIRSGFQDDVSFRQVLAEQNITFNDWKEALKSRLLEKTLFKELGKKVTPPSPQDIEAYYKSNKDSFKQGEKIYLRQIILSNEAQADLLRKDIGKKDFAEMAKKYTEGQDRNSGGLIGWIEKGSVEYFDPLFKMPIGTVSKTISSPFGFHIVKIERKMPARTLTLDEAKPEIQKKLVALKEQALYISWLDEQIKKHKVLKDSELINHIQVVTKGLNE